METGTLVKWNNNLIGGLCQGLFLKVENDTQSWVIATSVGNKPTRMKLLVETKILEVQND